MATFDDPRQADVWQTIRALNDAWTGGRPEQLAAFFHPDMVAITATDRLRRDGAAACIAGWTAFAASTTIRRWRETDPLVRVFGDAAVVAYYYEIVFEQGGQTIETGGRDLFFLVREAGRWWVVGDQFSGYPA